MRRNKLELKPFPTLCYIGVYSYENAFLDVNQMSKFLGEVQEAARTPGVFSVRHNYMNCIPLLEADDGINLAVVEWHTILFAY